VLNTASAHQVWETQTATGTQALATYAVSEQHAHADGASSRTTLTMTQAGMSPDRQVPGGHSVQPVTDCGSPSYPSLHTVGHMVAPTGAEPQVLHCVLPAVSW
jgi:hypothetical protein